MSHKLKEFYFNSHEQLRSWLKKNLSTPILERFGSIYLQPKEYKEFKDHYCQGCGRGKVEPRVVWGQEFCKECADKMEPGYRALKMLGHNWKFDIRKLFK